MFGDRISYVRLSVSSRAFNSSIIDGNRVDFFIRHRVIINEAYLYIFFNTIYNKIVFDDESTISYVNPRFYRKKMPNTLHSFVSNYLRCVLWNLFIHLWFSNVFELQMHKSLHNMWYMCVRHNDVVIECIKFHYDLLLSEIIIFWVPSDVFNTILFSTKKKWMIHVNEIIWKLILKSKCFENYFL